MIKLVNKWCILFRRMEAGIRKLLRIPFVLHRCKTLSNYTATLYTRPQNYENKAEDTLIYKRLYTLQQNIKKLHCTDTQEPMLLSLQEAKKITDGKEALQVLRDVSNTVKANPNAIELTKTEEFATLCSVIMRDIRTIPVHKLVPLLNHVTRLKIATDTMLVQTILQMLRVNINSLPVYQLRLLYILLDQHKDTHLVIALRKAVPYAFEIHLKSCIETRNLDLKKATENLKFSCYFGDKSLIYNCLKCIEDIITNGNAIPAEEYARTYSALSEMQYYTQTCIEVLTLLESKIKTHIEDLSTKDINLLMKSVCQQCSQMNQPHSERFIDILCNAVIQKNASFDVCTSLVRMLTDINRNNIPLIDYMAGMSIVNGHLQSAPISEIKCFLWALTTVDYKPVFWDDMKKIILERDITMCSHNTQLRLAVTLIALDCYHPQLIERVFTTDTKHPEVLFGTEEMGLLLELYQAVKTLYPVYTGPFPDDDTIERIKALSKNHEQISLNVPLAVALGGDQYLRTHLKTKLGHIIDYTVVMGPNGRPVITADSETFDSTGYIEDMKTPHDCQTILIFNFPKEAYSNNLERLNSRWQLKLKSIEALTGHSTLAINLQQWTKLPDFEKIPYLAQAIRLKCDNYVAHKNL